MKNCPLCPPLNKENNSQIIWKNNALRVVYVEDAHYPGFCRVIWKSHVAEMTDLTADERQFLMRVVFAVEIAQRDILSPHKINLASLGNQVPHVHWHVIPRFLDDAHFPEAIWTAPQRHTQPAILKERQERAWNFLPKAIQNQMNGLTLNSNIE